MEREVIPCCQEDRVHVDAVDQVRALLPPDEELYDLAELFKIFGDSTRIKILYALLEGELCVCDIAKLMEVTQSAVSHQLRVLKDSKLVRFRRDGKTGTVPTVPLRWRRPSRRLTALPPPLSAL